MTYFNRQECTRVRVHKDNAKKGIEWCYNTLGPKYRYLDPRFAGWDSEKQSNIYFFFFKKEGDAMMFKLAIPCLEETMMEEAE